MHIPGTHNHKSPKYKGNLIKEPKTVGQSLVCTNHKCVSGCIRANKLHIPGEIINSVIQAEGPGIVQYTTCAAVHGGPGIRYLIKTQIHHQGLSKEVCENGTDAKK